MPEQVLAVTGIHSQRMRRRTVSTILDETDAAMRRGAPPGARVWPTGLDEFDKTLTGGIRAGELVLVGGAQSKGKTTMGMQILRNAVVSGGTAVIFSYEHESTTILQRLLAMEAAEAAAATGQEYDPSEIAGIPEFRQLFELSQDSHDAIEHRFMTVPFGLDALAGMAQYAGRLHIHESNAGTTIDEIHGIIEEIIAETGDEPVVLVDYLQKVPVPSIKDETERITHVAEALKNMTLEFGVPVMAIVAADKANLGAGQRMRAHHLRGSSALAYEADVLIIVADKADVVSREHLVYDLGNASRFAQWTVLTVEKNRNGPAHVEIEFPKDFRHARVVPFGRPVSEKLIEERVFTS